MSRYMEFHGRVPICDYKSVSENAASEMGCRRSSGLEIDRRTSLCKEAVAVSISM